MNTLPCGCCEPPKSTPITAYNRPGLSAIAFRVGTYSSFRQSMLQDIAGTPALSALKTRSDDDYAITLMDLWATVADVLSFYQERIANEGYLRTARVRDSILRLARLLDYQLRPGVAATTLLAFTLDKNTSLLIPVGLRVQSVPADQEKPQIYETLESLSAEAALNSLRILPAPEGFNPLAKGSTSGILAPGPEGIEAAATLSPGTRLLLSDDNRIQELSVREMRTEADQITLVWSSPIDDSNWEFDSEIHAYNRIFRVFGYNAPASYLEAVESPPAGSGVFTWVRRTPSYAYTYPSSNILELDAKYEGITVGTRLLISQGGSSNQWVTVMAVDQGQAGFPNPLPSVPAAQTPALQDTVTRLAITPAPVISNRRNTLIYEITGSRIPFWGYRYPATLSGSILLAAARRLDAETVEVGRGIEAGKFRPGLRLVLKTLEVGRQLILRDAEGEPIAAEVAGVAAIGLEPAFATTPDDFSTALELRLDADQSSILTGLRSASFAGFTVTLTSSVRELGVTIGSLPARTIQLASDPVTLSTAASALQAALTASQPITPEFAQCRVTVVQNSLVVLTGTRGLTIGFGPTAADPTTAGELGLVSPGAFRIDALLSGNLSGFAGLSNPLRQMSVSLGPIGPRTIALNTAVASLATARTRLQTALIHADPAPAFRRALVTVVNSRLLVVPGSGGASIQEYLAITLQTGLPVPIDASSAVMLGNIAPASHGEKVSNEGLGDGDAAMVFQKFDLGKNPLTFIPSAEPGGTRSSLQILVNGVQWTEVPSLFGRSAQDPVYTSRIADDGTVALSFGDGRSGARLPSGRGNVVANYRVGAGLGGRVAAGALRTPLDLPVGLKSVTNPAAATGGADPESLEQARENAPSTVRTFGRAVSLRDFEDLVRASGEVAKALATWVWNREARAVHLTLGAQGGLLFTAADLTRFHASLTSQRDPNHALFLDNYVPVFVVVEAVVRVQPAYLASQVGSAARTALLAALAFDNQGFGQPLALSDLYAVLQQVAGVDSVDIDRFHFKNQSAGFLAARGTTADPVQRRLRVFSARPNTVPWPPALPAELAAIETPDEDIRITTSGGLPD